MYLTHIFSRGRVKVWVGVQIDLRVYGLNAAAFNPHKFFLHLSHKYAFNPHWIEPMKFIGKMQNFLEVVG